MTRLSWGQEVRRKAIQASGLVFVALGSWGAALLAVAVALDVLHLMRAGGLPLWRPIRALGERNEEKADPGPLLLATGLVITMLGASGPWRWAIACMPCLADSVACVAGTRLGGPRWPRSRKTVAGSASFLAVGALSGWVAGLSPAHAWTLAATGAAVEVISVRGMDNLTLCLVGLGVAAWLR